MTSLADRSAMRLERWFVSDGLSGSAEESTRGVDIEPMFNIECSVKLETNGV